MAKRNYYEDKLFEIFYQSQLHQSLDLNGFDRKKFATEDYRKDRLKQFKTWRENPDAIWIIVERDGEPVAYAATDFNKPFNELGVGDLCVDEKWRGKGIAKELTEKLIEKARELKAGSIFLGVHRNNLVARKLYEKAGFQYQENKYLDMKLLLSNKSVDEKQ